MGPKEGFTRLELMIAVVVVAIIAGLAVPIYLDAVRNVRAMQAVADLYAVRAAAYLSYGDTAAWPPEAPTGVLPSELKGRMPGTIRFTGEHYRLDWENWAGQERDARGRVRRIFVGIAVVSADPKLLAEVERLLSRSSFAEREPGKVTLRVAGPNGL